MAEGRDERFGGWAPQSIVDRNHAELKQMITEQSVVISDMRARTQELEFHVKEHRNSLNNGAASFTKLNERLNTVGERMNAIDTKIETKFNPKWSTLIGMLVLVGGWIWQMSRYPDQTQFEAAKRDISAIQQQQTAQQRDFSNMQRDITKIDEKLDRMLLTKP